jgi:hypothetical protein
MNIGSWPLTVPFSVQAMMAIKMIVAIPNCRAAKASASQRLVMIAKSGARCHNT